MAKVLLVEDDLALSAMIEDFLGTERHVVETVDSGEEGLNRLKFYTYDILILDWELPDLHGIDLLRTYRSGGGNLPVLMLTGKSKLNDKEAGFEAGVDDYLTKPFHMRELGLRIKALLRRPSAISGNVIAVDNLELDRLSLRVTRSGVPIDLMPKEFALLEFMMSHPNQVFSPESLQDRLWSSDSEASVDAVRQCMKRLRKKVEMDGQRQLITTIHGVGYRLDA